MAKLDLFSGRQPHIVELAVNGEKREFQISTDYTVEQSERLLELSVKLKEAQDSKDTTAVNAIIFAQLHMLFATYQPDLTVDDLKKMVTWPEAIRIINFVSEHTAAVSRTNEAGEAADSEKKAPSKG